jgi:large subunit ribosomal protein L39e
MPIIRGKMARNKTPKLKTTLSVANRTRKRAPVWVFAKTNRKVRDSPKSNRNWRRDNIF